MRCKPRHPILSTSHIDTASADTPADGDVLTYDIATGLWSAEAPAGGVTSHPDLTDRDQKDHSKYGALEDASVWTALQTFNVGVKLAAAQAVKDSGGTDRYKPATSTPHNILEGDVRLNGWVGVNCAPTANVYLSVNPLSVGFPTGTTYLAQIAAASSNISNSNTTLIAVFGAPIITIAPAKTGINVAGLSFALGLGGGSGSIINSAKALSAGTVLLNVTGTITELITIEALAPYILFGSPILPKVYGLKMGSLVDGVDRYGLSILDISGGTKARILELGGVDAAALMTLQGTGEWTPAADETPLYLAADAGPTLYQVTLGADDSGGAGFRCLRMPN